MITTAGVLSTVVIMIPVISTTSGGMLWRRVDDGVDSALGCRRCAYTGCTCMPRASGRTRCLAVPPALEEHVRFAKVNALAGRMLLKRARAAYDGPLVLLKDPEAAARYPSPPTATTRTSTFDRRCSGRTACLARRRGR